MKPWLWLAAKWAAAMACVVGQVTMVPSWSVFGCKPDVPLLVVVVIGLMGGMKAAAWWGGVLGLFLDGVSLAPFGVHAVLLSGMGAGVGAAHLQMNKQFVMVPAIVYFVVSLIYLVGFFFLEVLIDPGFSLNVRVIVLGIGGACYGAILAPLCLKGFQWVESWGMKSPPRRRAWSV